MDTLITYNEVATLVANPPSIGPRPNFTNLRNSRHHIQCALQCLSCPQSNILGWAGLIMARAMYGLFTASPFRLPSDLGLLAIYYPPPVPIVDPAENPVLDAEGMPTYCNQPTIACAEQATIDAPFKRAKNYWESYMNIQRAVNNCLDDNINNAFKVLNDLDLIGWNPSMEPREMFNQITATYGRPTPAALLQIDTLFWSVYSPKMPPKFCFVESKIARKYRSLERIHTWCSSYLTMLYAFSSNAGSTPAILKIRTAKPRLTRSGST
jgi:hypothetical protein